MTAKPNSDRAMEKALRRTLGEGLDTTGSPEASGCPDASILAAYFDRDLPADEAAHWETHFSSCALCQEQLAVLARTESAEPRPAAQPAAWRRFWTLRWVAPLATAAAAVALWVVLRPVPNLAPSRTGEIAQSAAKDQTSLPALQAPSREAAPPSVSAKPAEADKLTTSGGGAKLPGPKRSAPAAPAVTRAEPSAVVAGGQVAARPKRVDEAAPPSPSAGAEITGKVSTPPVPANAPLESQTRDAKKNREAESVEKKNENAFAQAAGAPKAQQEQVLADSGSQETRAKSVIRAPAQGALAMGKSDQSRQQGGFLRSAPVVVTVPGGNTQWRFGPLGEEGRASLMSARIEKSSDAGKTWTPQTTPVTVNLLAGSAPNEKVCWAVGAGGTILRTTDGEHWEQIISPTAIDLYSVTARDALRATIIAVDGKTYVTSDGGRTWKQK